IGHAETLRGLSQAFHLRHTHETFYYQLRDEAPAWVEPAASPAEPPREPPVAAASGDWVGPWLEAVARSSARIRALQSGLSEPSAPGAKTAAGAQPARSDLSRPLELLRHERFADALELMQGLSPEDGRDPAALLLRAALLTQKGEIEAAEAACREVLRRDELN